MINRAVISSLDLARCARLLHRRHGDDAPIWAALEADRRLDLGDVDGALLWLAIGRECAIGRQ